MIIILPIIAVPVSILLYGVGYIFLLIGLLYIYAPLAIFASLPNIIGIPIYLHKNKQKFKFRTFFMNFHFFQF